MRVAWCVFVLVLSIFDGLHCEELKTSLDATSTNSTCDTEKEFDCGSGKFRCIPEKWHCDNVVDCENGEDEDLCTYLHDCSGEQMICPDASCISKEFKCDGENDCKDGSDESHCDLYEKMKNETRNAELETMKADTHWLSCRNGFSMCYTSHVCLPNNYFCDGEQDCADGSDEMNCGLNMTRKHTDKEYVLTNGCALKGKFSCRPEKGDKVGSCVPMSSTCNGLKDCPYGDDEPMQCSECSRTRCDHTCKDTVYGARCSCNQGFKLAEDGLSCEKEDQCKEYGHLCQQYCEDRNSSYVCKCAAGYELKEDGRSCRFAKYTSSEGYLFVSMHEEIRQMSLPDYQNETNYAIIQKHKGKSAIKSIHYMHRTNKMFLAISEDHEYKKSTGNLAMSQNGRMTMLRENLAGIKRVEVDWIGGNVFFTQENSETVAGIAVCSIDGLYCRQVVETPVESRSYWSKSNKYRNMVIHPLRGLIIWAEVKSECRLMMADMNGENEQVLLEGDVGLPNSLAIDIIRNDVYFAGYDKIESVNIDTKRRVLIIEGTEEAGNHDMVFFNGMLYWIEWRRSFMKMMDPSLKNTKPINLHDFHGKQAFGIAVNHSLFQPQPSFNPCSNFKCQWICVAVPNENNTLTAQCLCPDGYKNATIGNTATCIPPAANETESLKKYSHIGQHLMTQKCKAGTACKNGGKCRDLLDRYGKVERTVCSCQGPYDGLYCEVYNENLVKTIIIQGTSRNSNMELFVLFLSVVLLAIVVCTLIYFCIVKRKRASELLTSARSNISEFFTKPRSRKNSQEDASVAYSRTARNEKNEENRETNNNSSTSYGNPNYDSERVSGIPPFPSSISVAEDFF